MAKLVVLLCFTALLGVALARDRRSVIARGGPLNSVQDQERGSMAGRLGALHDIHRMLPRFDVRGGQLGSLRDRFRRPRPSFRGGRRNSLGTNGMHRMELLKGSEREGGRIPSHRVFENMRAELNRFHQARGGQGQGQRGHRGFPDIGAAYDIHDNGMDPQMSLLAMDRAHRGRHHLGNGRRGMHHLGMRMGHGRGHMGHRFRGHGLGPRYAVP